MHMTFKCEWQKVAYNFNTSVPTWWVDLNSWVVPRLPPTNPKWRTAAILNGKNAKYLHNRWRHLHTVWYKDATRGRLWTTTARRLSAYNVVDSVATTTTACFYISTGTQQGRVLHPCVFTYALAYILLVTVLVCTYCVNFFWLQLGRTFFLLFQFVYNWLFSIVCI